MPDACSPTRRRPSGASPRMTAYRPHRMVPLVVAFALVPASVLASTVDAPHVQVALVAETASIQPGSELQVGLRFAPERGWHVYWRNPGDSGEAPRLTWRLPDGFTASELAWPAPERIPVGPFANF